MKRVFALVLTLSLLLCAVAAAAESEAPTFEQLSDLEWSFSSGAGGWSTELRIAPDGSFSGEFHDSERGEAGEGYPNGSLYYCAFTGQMSVGEQIDENSWRVRVDSLTQEQEAGVETIEDDIRYVTADPYGISEGDEMRLFLPGTPVEALTEDMRMWAHLLGEDAPAALEDWFLYSEANDSGFVGYSLEGLNMANPWLDLTAEELQRASGLSFNVPEGAENVVYRWLEDENLAEMQFTLGGDEYCARVKPSALENGEMENISGMYFAWENAEDITVGGCPGTIGQAQTGSEDWVELCQWYDAAPGLVYALSVYTTDPDGLDLTAVAEMVYAPMQADA